VTKAPLAPPVSESDDPEYAAMLGPQCAMLPELFGNKHRYLGVAVTREFSAVIAGGLAGVLGAILIAAFDGSWVPLGVYTFVLAAITFGTTFIAPETQGRDLLQVEDALDDVRAVDDVRAGVLVSR
jgi:MFS transporter, MHS family, metabolite:H+ symporter